MILALLRAMRRSVKALPLLLLVFVGIGYLFRGEGEPAEPTTRPIGPGLAHTPDPAPELPPVKIEETLVTAEFVETPRAEAPAAEAPLAPAASTIATRTAPSARRSPSSKSTNLVARTGRAIVGDGRHRPQPFPRVNNN